MTVYVCVCLALGLGALVQTVAGFGSALVAMPLLAQLLGVRTAAPVQAILGFLVTISILYQNRRGLRWREALPLIAGGVFGIPLGALALRTLPSEPIIGCLGGMMLAYAGFALWIQPRLRPSAVAENGNHTGTRLRGREEIQRGMSLPPEVTGLVQETRIGSACPVTSGGSDIPNRVLSQAMIAWLVGFASGILGGAYATDGPPLIVYGSVKRWSKETFKSILQACFLVNGIVVVACHATAGLVTRDVLVYCCFGVPGVLGGMLLGAWLDRRIDHERFRRLLLGLIVVLGAALVARAVLGG